MIRNNPASLIASIALSLSLCISTLALPQQQVLVPVPDDRDGQWFGRNGNGGLSATEEGLLMRFELCGPEEMDRMLSLVERYDLDVWQHTNTRIDIFTPPNSELPSSVLDNFPFFELTPIQMNLPTPLASHPPDLPPPSSDRWNLSSLTNTTFHATYHPIFEIDEFMHTLAALYPDKVTQISLGHSAQGREMYVLKVASARKETDGDGGKGKKKKKDKKKSRKGKGKKGKKVMEECEDIPGEWEAEDWELELDELADTEMVSVEGDAESTLKRRKQRGKRAFVLTGAQHAREWVASASALYLAHALATDPSEDGSLANLLENFEFHIIPVPNPDGYVYTWENDRFWYKNRMVVDPDETCQGLDMNRNWGYEWSPSLSSLSSYSSSRRSHPHRSHSGTPSPNPCSYWYPGHRPFEAPEVNNIANYVLTNVPKRLRAAFVDLRSYGQMLSAPFSFSCDALPIDAENLFEAAINVEFAVRKKHGSVYTSGRLCETLYSAPGNILDWMYGDAGFTFAYAAHLRDTGTYGFSLPEKWIRPVGEETGTIVQTLVGFMEFVWRL